MRPRRRRAAVVTWLLLVTSGPVYAQGAAGVQATWSPVTWTRGLLTGASAFAQSSLHAPEEKQSASQPPISYGMEITVRSGHADRGYIISDRPVFQPVTWASWNGAEFSVWGNVPLAPNTDTTRSQIVELEIVHEQEWGRFTIGPAIRTWFYRDPLSKQDRYEEPPANTVRCRGQGRKSAQQVASCRPKRGVPGVVQESSYSIESIEGWLYLSFDAGPVRLFTNQSLDVATYKGAYFGEAGVAAELDVTQAVGIGGQLGAGWASAMFNDAYFGVNEPALNRTSAEVWLTVYATPRFYSRLNFDLNTTLDPRLRVAAGRPTYLLVGLSVGAEF